MVWVKQVVDSVSMSTWSRSFYQNALAVPPMLLVSLISGEMAIVLRGGAGSFAWGMVAASCVAGVGMSYFSFALRASHFLNNHATLSALLLLLEVDSACTSSNILLSIRVTCLSYLLP